MAGEIQIGGTTFATESGGTVTVANVNSATNRTNLGLGSIATQNANAVALTGGSLTGTEIDLKSSGTTIYKSDGSTAVISESGATVTLNNATLGSAIIFPAGNIINAGYAELTDSLNKTTNFNTSAITLGTTSNTYALRSSTNKVLLFYSVYINKIDGGTGAYCFSYFNGGGLGTGSSGARLTGGQLYNQANATRESATFHMLDTNPNSTTPSYSVYWDVDDVSSEFNFEFQRILYFEIQG